MSTNDAGLVISTSSKKKQGNLVSYPVKGTGRRVLRAAQAQAKTTRPDLSVSRERGMGEVLGVAGRAGRRGCPAGARRPVGVDWPERGGAILAAPPAAAPRQVSPSRALWFSSDAFHSTRVSL